MSCVPMAPSKTTTRSPSRRRYSDISSCFSDGDRRATRISPTARPARLYTLGRAKSSEFRRLVARRARPAARRTAIVEGAARARAAVEHFRDVAVSARDGRDAVHAFGARLCERSLPAPAASARYRTGRVPATYSRMRHHRIAHDAQAPPHRRSRLRRATRGARTRRAALRRLVA